MLSDNNFSSALFSFKELCIIRGSYWGFSNGWYEQGGPLVCSCTINDMYRI